MGGAFFTYLRINQEKILMKIRIWGFLFTASLVVFTCSCTAWRVGRATAHLEVVEQSEDKWGKIAISGMEFVPNKGQFSISYNEDMTNYVQAARNNISGDASSSIQSALYLGAQFQGMFAPPIAINQPGNTTNLPSQVNIPNQAQTAVNNFPQPPAAAAATPTVDESVAVAEGTNNKLAEDFLKFMANPTVDS